MFSFATEVKSSVFDGEDKYEIKDEAGYAILLYDYTNSLILNFLGSEGELPDHRLEIERIRELRPDDVSHAEMRAAMIIGRMNLPEFKRKVIEHFKKEDISILDGKYSLESLSYVGNLFAQNVEEIMQNFRAQGGLKLEDAFISYYMFPPHVDYDAFPKDVSEKTINEAIGIAVTRFDNLHWFQEIKSCMNENRSETEGIADGIIKCAEDYRAVTTIETVRVLAQMRPYMADFNRISPLGEGEEMVKLEEENGNYLWGRKKKIKQ